MKILFTLHHFLPQSIGGTEIYTLNLAQHLQKLGIDTLVVIPNLDNSNTEEYFYQGIRVIRYAEETFNDRDIIMGKKEPEGLKIFVEILIHEKPDIVHFHEITAGRGISILHAEKANNLNIPIVLTCHLSSYTCLNGSLIYKDIEKCDGLISIEKCTACMYHSKGILGNKAKLLNLSAGIFFKKGINPTLLNSTIGTALGFPFVIKKVKTDLLKLASITKKIIILTEWYKTILEKNGVPTQKLIKINQGLATKSFGKIKYSKENTPVKIVFIGRISEVKGVHLLIDAICKIEMAKISLYIYGPETESDYSFKCKQKSSSQPNIHWMGVIESNNVLGELSKYHVLCLPSIFSEMNPLVIQEAFAAGLPVLASDVYGNAEQITDGINGWLFRFKDINHLTEKLKILTNNFSLIVNASLNLPKTYKFSYIAKEHSKLYLDILKVQ